MRPGWEYLIIEEPNPTALQRCLAQAGAEGWEAVGVASAGEGRLMVVMKRSSAATSP
jgi:hypothetical protein